MRFSLEDFLDCVDLINSKNYDYGNEVLYRNCGFGCLPDPNNSTIDTKFSSAIWLIGKSYSADPTRSAPKDTFSNNGLGSSFEKIATHVCSAKEDYAVFYKELNKLREAKYSYTYEADQEKLRQTVELVAKLNWMIKDAMVEIAKEKGIEDRKSDNVVSFCSKFLHFMCPHLFFIIDSFSFNGGAALFAKAKGRKLDISDIEPSRYIDIDAAKAFFKKQYQDVSPLSLKLTSDECNDAIMSYYAHCLRAYRLACFLHENERECARQIKVNSNSCYMPRLVDSVLMRITKDTAK